MTHIKRILLVACLLLPGISAGEQGNATSVRACGSSLYEVQRMELDFQRSDDITHNLDLTGDIGTNYEESGSCNKRYHVITASSCAIDIVFMPSGNRYADFSHDTSINFSGIRLPRQWTLHLWVNLNAAGVVMEGVRWQGVVEEALVIFLSSDNKVTLHRNESDEIRDGGQWRTLQEASSRAGVTLNQWQHVAITVSGLDVSFFLNGVQDSTSPFIVSNATTGSSLCFGRCNDNSFAGKTDNITFVNRILSADEINTSYQSTKSQF